jgi:hypothetical protein
MSGCDCIVPGQAPWARRKRLVPWRESTRCQRLDKELAMIQKRCRKMPSGFPRLGGIALRVFGSPNQSFPRKEPR